MRLNIECKYCGKNLFLDKKDIKIGVHTKKGEEVYTDDYNKTESQRNFNGKRVRHMKKIYKTTKDIKEKYYISFISNEKIFIKNLNKDDII